MLNGNVIHFYVILNYSILEWSIQKVLIIPKSMFFFY